MWVFLFPQLERTTHFFVSSNYGRQRHENKRQDRLKGMTKKLRSANYLYRGHDTKRTLTIPCCHIGQFVTHHWMNITRSIISHYQKQRRWWWLWWLWCWWWLHTCNDVAIIRPAWEARALTHARTHTYTPLVSLVRQLQWLASSLGTTCQEVKRASGVISFSVI